MELSDYVVADNGKILFKSKISNLCYEVWGVGTNGLVHGLNAKAEWKCGNFGYMQIYLY